MTDPAGPQGPASLDDVRRRNLSTLLSLLHARRNASRADLTALTGLNRSTVKTLTADLAAAGLVRETAPVGRGGAGRPSITVEPESDAVYVIALDVGVSHLTALRVGLGGVVQDRRQRRAARRLRRAAHGHPRGQAGARAARRRPRRRGLRRHRRRGVRRRSAPTTAWCASPPTCGWVDVPLRAAARPAPGHLAADRPRQRRRPRGARRAPARRRAGPVRHGLHRRRGRHRRRHHHRRPAAARGRRLRRRDRPHGGRPARRALPLRAPRLLGDRRSATRPC